MFNVIGLVEMVCAWSGFNNPRWQPMTCGTDVTVDDSRGFRQFRGCSGAGVDREK